MNRTLRNAVTTTALIVTALGSTQALASPDPAIAAGRDLLQQTLAAHGGLDTWRSFGRLDYAISDFPLGARAPLAYSQTVALGPRLHRVDGEGFTAGFDGDRAWIVPDAESLGLPPRFFLSGNFYFVGMPFVFGDPGVIARALDSEEIGGRTYDRIAITYDATIGDSAEDDYILYVDPETRRLHMIDFRPTAVAIRGGASIDELPRKVLVFDDWQTVGGLEVPSPATFHAVENGEIAAEGATYSISSVRLSSEHPSASLFAIPSGAEIDDTHASQ